MKYLLALLLAVASAFGGYAVAREASVKLGGVNPAIIIGATNYKTSVTSTARVVLAANSGRQGAEVCNAGTADIYLGVFAGSVTSTSLTSTATNYFASSTGRIVKASDCWSFKRDEEVPTGAIWAIATTTAQNVSALEFSE